MSAADAAKAMGISLNALYVRIANGVVQAEKIGQRTWLVPESEVERFRGVGKLPSGPKVGSKRTRRSA